MDIHFKMKFVDIGYKTELLYMRSSVFVVNRNIIANAIAASDIDIVGK